MEPKETTTTRLSEAIHSKDTAPDIKPLLSDCLKTIEDLSESLAKETKGRNRELIETELARTNAETLGETVVCLHKKLEKAKKEKLAAENELHDIYNTDIVKLFQDKKLLDFLQSLETDSLFGWRLTHDPHGVSLSRNGYGGPSSLRQVLTEAMERRTT